MPATIEVNPEPDHTVPRARITIRGAVAGSGVFVSRLDADGRVRPVRTAYPITVDAQGTGIAYDYEMPYGLPTRYTIAADNVIAPPATVAPSRPYLVDPGMPALSFRLDVARVGVGTLSTLTRARSSVDIDILNSPVAVPHVQGSRKAPAGTLLVRVITGEEAAALDTLLDSGRTLLLNVPAALSWPVSWSYITIDDIAIVGGRILGDPERMYDMPFRSAPRPAGAVRPEWTWDAAEADGLTWDAAGLLYATWNDFTTNTRKALP